MSETNIYYSGQGSLYVADRDAQGKPSGGFRAVGNVPSISLGLETQRFEHNESTTGNRAIDLTIVQQLSGTVSLSFESISPENWAIAFFGEVTTVAGAAVVDEEVAVAATGVKYPLANVNIDSSVAPVVADGSAGSLTIDDDYVIDWEFGTIELVDGYSGTLPDTLSVGYTHLSHFSMTAFDVNRLEKWLRFNGINTARTTGNKVIVDIFKAEFDPAQAYDLINDELAALAIEGRLLFDELNAADGGFFKERRTQATT